MEEKSKSQELKEKLTYKKPDMFEKLGADGMAKCSEYAAGYMKFIDAAKTEREAVQYGIKLAEEKGFVEHKLGDVVVPGGKYYYNNRGKQLFVFTVGSEPANGVVISAAHVDSPRIDLKPMPLYEDSGFAFFKTHYYGGVKKYQWTTVPLAIHGVVTLASGETVDVAIGEDDCDPIFYITDLLPHLAKDQMARSLADGITGEGLNILVGSQPYPGYDGDEKIKLNILSILNEKYGMTEADFRSAELTMVPALKARDVGLDRSFIGAYGHDDRVCAYTALTAVLDTESPHRTVMAVLADKEEIGSVGISGMQSQVFDDLMQDLAESAGVTSRELRAVSVCLSADVNAAFDPNFGEVYERRNTAFANGGVVLTKYTGSRGKSGSSDASAELMGRVGRILDKAGVVWQTGELGKVDQGGGGTVAGFVANRNIETVDLGVPVLSMHAPYELIAKTDLYMTYLAFRAFNAEG
ncbi:MAG: aminopeptidase [Eubacteriales bacterium]|jgi:aspartyl aminopeptidase|nr:aminopeptidase [Clostridiales bacterium]